MGTWNDSGDPTIHTKLEIDIDKLDDFLNEYNAKNPENKMSHTVIMTKAIG